jgi:hypothetical protein
LLGALLFAPAADAGDGNILIADTVNYNLYSVSPNALVPDTTLLAGSSVVLVSLKEPSIGARVLRAFNSSGGIFAPSPDYNFSSDDFLKPLASLNGFIFFHIHTKFDATGRVFIYEESTRILRRPLDIPLMPRFAVDVSAAVINNLVAIRWAQGDVALCNISSCITLPRFSPWPFATKSKKLVYSTQGGAAKLFFPHVDNSMREFVYVSPPLPCISDSDCTMWAATPLCSSRGFCSPAQPPQNSAIPVGSSAPLGLSTPFSPPLSSSAIPTITVCIPPVPLNAVCGPSGWIINNTVVVTPGSTVIITSPTTINGNFSTSPGSTINITLTQGGAPLVVAGCVEFAGALNVQFSQPTQTGANMPLITFDGYCNGTRTTFTTTQISLGGCAKLKPTATNALQYSDTSLSLIFGAEDIDSSDCSSNVSGGLSTGAIAGIAVGAVFFVLIIIFIIVWVKRDKIIPYYRSRADLRKKQSNMNQQL